MRKENSKIIKAITEGGTKQSRDQTEQNKTKKNKQLKRNRKKEEEIEKQYNLQYFLPA